MKKSALLYVVLASVLWGTSGLFSNWLRPYGFTAVQMTAIRGTVAAIILVSYLLICSPQLLKVVKKDIPLLIGSGLSLFCAATLYYLSIEASSVSTAVILMYTAPVFVLIYSVLFLGEKLNKAKLLSVALMIIGCALVSGIVGGMKFSFWGVVFGLASGISYSAYNVFTKLLTMHKVNVLTVTCYCFIMMGGIALCISDPVQIVSLTAQAPLDTAPLIIGIGIFACVLPYLFYTLALRDIPAGTASALGIIEPMAATLFSVAFLGEQLSAPSLCGIVLILIAVFILAKQRQG